MPSQRPVHRMADLARLSKFELAHENWAMKSFFVDFEIFILSIRDIDFIDQRY